MRVPSIVGAIGAIVLAAALGCGPKATVQTPTTQPSTETPVDPCLSFHSTASLADTIVVALFDEVDPTHAPEWRNESERLVFQQLYESVNNLSICGGILAEFRISKDGRVASLKLRDNARFWDGTLVTSHDLAETLENAKNFVEGLDSITIRDTRTIDVHASGPSVSGASSRFLDWRALTSPALAITKPTRSNWPMGTGPYQVVDSGTPGRNLTIRPAFDSSKPMIQFVDARGMDARDLLDPGFRPRVDFMIIGDPGVVAYATSEGRFHAKELPPSKAYFLLSLTRVRALETHDLPTIPDSMTTAIARDALRSVNAWSLKSDVVSRYGLLGYCDAPAVGTTFGGLPTARRVLYDASDPTACDLADRIVALAGGDPSMSTDVAALLAAVPGLSSTSASPVAVGVGGDELATSMAKGADFAYVVALPLQRPEHCFLPRELIRMAPWLGTGLAPIHLKAIPLVVTLPYAVAARSGSGVPFALHRDLAGSITLIVGTTRAESP